MIPHPDSNSWSEQTQKDEKLKKKKKHAYLFLSVLLKKYKIFTSNSSINREHRQETSEVLNNMFILCWHHDLSITENSISNVSENLTLYKQSTKRHVPASTLLKVGMFMSVTTQELDSNTYHMATHECHSKYNTATMWTDLACTPRPCVRLHSNSYWEEVSPCVMSIGHVLTAFYSLDWLVEGRLRTTL